MIIKPQHSLSLLILASTAHNLRADCDWKDVAAAGIIGAGIGAACVYAASCDNDCSTTHYASPYNSSSYQQALRLKRSANETCETIYNANKQLIWSYRSHCSEQTVQLMMRKGKEYQSCHWYINSVYRDEACKVQTPVLHGYAALLNEAAQLRKQRDNLIEFFGSRNAARIECRSFDDIERLAHLLQEIATTFEQHHLFTISRDHLCAYRMHQDELARTKRKLQQAQDELAALNKHPRFAHGYDYYYAESVPQGSHIGFSMNFYQ